MHYMTRHLEALTEIPLGSAFHRQGDEFFATVIDADYLISQGKAREVVPSREQVPAPAPRAVAAPVPAPAAPPAAVEAQAPLDVPAAPPESPVVVAESPAPAAAEAAPPPAEAPNPSPAPTSRRRNVRQATTDDDAAV